MATNFFWIGYHFEKFRSLVALRKKINFMLCIDVGNYFVPEDKLFCWKRENKQQLTRPDPTRYLYHFSLSVMVMLVIYWHCSEICVKWVQQELFLYITTIKILFWFCLILFSSVLDWKFFNQSHNIHNRYACFNLNPVSFSCFALDFRHFPIYLVRYTFCVHCCWVANTSFSSFSNLVLLVLVLFLLV